jgi:hypothetical protein
MKFLLFIPLVLLAACGDDCVHSKCVTRPVTAVDPYSGRVIVTVATACVCLDEELGLTDDR